MAHTDDKSRGSSVREASRLRATLGSEPSGGYAYHDQGRVERVERVRPVSAHTPEGALRPRGEEAVAPQAASHAPKERSFARTLVGGMTIQEALAERAEVAAKAANDQQRPSARGSWPPMPHVPSDLVGSMDYDDEPSGINLRETQPGTRAGGRGQPRSAHAPEGTERATPTAKLPSSNPPALAGGAIWQAMPSVAELTESLAMPEPAPEPARVSPVPFRPSLAELEAEQSHRYRDPRVLGYEALVERNDWEKVHERVSGESDLSPTLQLLKIIARRETLRGDEKRESAQLTQQAIACVAQILGLPEASPTALVLGKRLLRKIPGWTKAEAATPGISVAIVLSGLSIGVGIGWLVTRLLF